MSCASNRILTAPSARRPVPADRGGTLAAVLPLVVSAVILATLGIPSHAAAQTPPWPGQIEDGRPPTAPIFPPGPWRACLILCPTTSEPNGLEAARYFCTHPCVGLALAGYDCQALKLDEWLAENGWTLCPEGAVEGC